MMPRLRTPLLPGRGGGQRSTVRLLEARARAPPAELFRLAPPGVGHDERAVVSHEDVLDVLLRCLVDVLLVVGDDPLRYGLSHCVDLTRVTAALHAQSVRLHSVDRATVDTDLAGASAHQRDSHG